MIDQNRKFKSSKLFFNNTILALVGLNLILPSCSSLNSIDSAENLDRSYASLESENPLPSSQTNEGSKIAHLLKGHELIYKSILVKESPVYASQKNENNADLSQLKIDKVIKKIGYLECEKESTWANAAPESNKNYLCILTKQGEEASSDENHKLYDRMDTAEEIIESNPNYVYYQKKIDDLECLRIEQSEQNRTVAYRCKMSSESEVPSANAQGLLIEKPIDSEDL